MNILVSSCLLGAKCRYDGTTADDETIEKMRQLGKSHTLIPVCPEVYGGLATPREAAEIINGQVMTKTGNDVTVQYQKGAEETLYLAGFCECRCAILKERSPSCGYGKIHDGLFDGKLIDGNGFTAKLLADNGIRVIGESQIDELEECLERFISQEKQ